MNTKRKLILMGICLVAILILFTINVIRRVKSDDPEVNEIVVNENIMTRAEAYRLLSYLEYDKPTRENLSMGIIFEDDRMSGWYDSFLNAVWKMGLIEENVTVHPNEALTYGACKELLDQLIIINPKFQEIYMKISFDFATAEEEMTIPHFLEAYEAIIDRYEEDESPIREEVLFVLGEEANTKRVVTDQGNYYTQYARDYHTFLEEIREEVSGDNPGATDDNENEDKENNVEEKPGVLLQYEDQGVKAFVRGQEIIYITKVSEEKTILQNVWIKEGSGSTVEVFIGGIHKTFQAKAPLSTEIKEVVGNITVEAEKVVQISVKPDIISGKVLLSGDDFIEIDGYGKIPMDEDYRIYKVYGELSLEPTNRILVGYETTDFVVSNGKISAALIKESIKAKNIRVLLKTTNHSDMYHSKVELTSDTDYTVRIGDEETSYEAGTTLTIEPGDTRLAEGRIKIVPETEQGKIQVLTMERSSGKPKYRGVIEVEERDQGLLIINELPLEEYLYAVIPSEMPTYYGLEPLKVQAVCARSYAYKHLIANSLNNYGAHVDDSVSYQVYNNIPENENSILAVKDTYGKVIEHEGEIITAYYFSTSCGHTTGVEHVWANGTETPYLRGKLMATEDSIETLSQGELQGYQDLTIEENFRNFIMDNNLSTYDSSYQWYRWKVTMASKEIQKAIDQKLASRYDANPSLIQTLVDASENQYESIPIDTVGEILDIYVGNRATGGLITELIIKGSKNTVKVKTEYNIRTLLAPTNDTLVRADESEVKNLSLLPSAFFVIDKKESDGKLKNITLTGGGYGHGVGMSQNGVKAMSDAGKDFDEILQYFYEGTEIGFIYE